MHSTSQIDLLERAFALLGGQAATAQRLGINPRTMRRLLSGERRLHQGFLEDLANALHQQADDCRALERQLSPAFAGNLQADQQRPLHGNTLRRRAAGGEA